MLLQWLRIIRSRVRLEKSEHVFLDINDGDLADDVGRNQCPF